ncbi:hypothetical protein ABZZ17_06590 [Streptomyces sp. NPDC006512]|uniref:hypothetical protein n=1 Tax=Streptomyces sp. NPDC006512 TaxID=3154307 RepID=UPI0033AEFC84
MVTAFILVAVAALIALLAAAPSVPVKRNPSPGGAGAHRLRTVPSPRRGYRRSGS